MTGPLTGSCLCGDVIFRIDGPIAHTEYCHCIRCRKFTGHFLASGDVAQDRLVLTQGAESLAWYPTETAERGFCVICGSSLFWRALGENVETVAVSLGALDGETGLSVEKTLCAEEAGDYYPLPPVRPGRDGDG